MVASELDPISEIPLGLSPRALSRASSVCLGARKHRGKALSSTCPLTRSLAGLASLERPAGRNLGGHFLRKHRLALISRVGSSRSWLLQPCLEAYQKNSRKMPLRHLIVVLGMTLNVYKFSLAKATGPFVSHGSFCPVQRKRPGYPSKEARGGKIKLPPTRGGGGGKIKFVPPPKGSF